MGSFELLFYVLIVVSMFSLGSCNINVPGAEEYFQMNRGSVTLKSSVNPTLCVRPVKFNETVKSLQLIDCQLKFDNYPYEGDGNFVISSGGKTYYHLKSKNYVTQEDGRKTPDWSHAIRQNDGYIVSVPSDWLIFTKWRFPKVDGDQILVEMQDDQRGRNPQCLHVGKIENGTALDTADCNNKDPKQIWISQFKEQDAKVSNTEYDKNPGPEKGTSKGSILQISSVLFTMPLCYIIIIIWSLFS